MPTDEWHAVRIEARAGPGQQLVEVLRNEAGPSVRQHRDGQRVARLAAHGVDIAESVVGSNFAEYVGVQPKGAKEIDALGSEVLGPVIHYGCVVPRGQAEDASH